jgi:hypothetical protein
LYTVRLQRTNYNYTINTKQYRVIVKKKWTTKKILTITGIVAVVALIFSSYYFTSGRSRLNVDTERITISEIKKRSFQEFIPVNGIVLPVTTIYLDAVEGGRVEEKFVEDGAMMHKGQPILRLANTDLERGLVTQQDYGYWYKNGFLFPDAMISVMVALTEATKENGCLQVLKGSHKMGRLEHMFAGEQQGADMPFVEEALKLFERVYVELEPGDLLFFHSNILHMSEANLSNGPRWSLISAYNLSYNKPFREKNTSCITPVNVVPDNAIMESDPRGLSEDIDFLKKENEITLQ